MAVFCSSSARVLVACVGLAAAGVGLTGCWTEGGLAYSQDAYTYVSTEWLPQTVTLVDTRTGQAVWSQEVPVGKKLVMRFTSGEDLSNKSPDPLYSDKLEWDLWPATKDFGSPSKSAWVPKVLCRRVDVKYRPVPEAEPPAPDLPPEGTPTDTMPPVR